MRSRRILAASFLLLSLASAAYAGSVVFMEQDRFFRVLEFEAEAERPLHTAADGRKLTVPGPRAFEKGSVPATENQGVWLGRYSKYPDGAEPEFFTEGRLSFDNHGIYIRHELEKHPGEFEDKIIICLDPYSTGQEYFMLEVSLSGDVLDSLRAVTLESDPTAVDPRESMIVVKSDDSWNSGAEVRVENTPEFWIMEVNIPFENLGFERAPEGIVWGANFSRVNLYNGELSQWRVKSGRVGSQWGAAAVEAGDANLPQSFGLLLFDFGERDLSVEWRCGTLGYGMNYLEAVFENSGAEKAAEIELDILNSEGKSISAEKFRWRIEEGVGRAIIPFKIPFAIEGGFRVSALLSGDELFFPFTRMVELKEMSEFELQYDRIFIGDEAIRGSLRLNVGLGTLENTNIIFRLRKNGKLIWTSLGNLKKNIINFGISAEMLEEGEYFLEVECRENGRLLDKHKRILTVLAPPFNF